MTRALPVELWSIPASEAADALRRGTCPICGDGPWDSVLNHASRQHAWRGRDMREACGVTTTERFTSDSAHEAYAANGVRNARDGRMATLHARRGSGRRFTTAGRRAVSDNLGAWAERDPEGAAEQRGRLAERARDPERLARLHDGARAWHRDNPLDGDAKARFAELMARPDVVARREAAVRARLAPCGTVAAYKRGCRCEDCRNAKRASRKRA